MKPLLANALASFFCRFIMPCPGLAAMSSLWSPKADDTALISILSS
jgi:hypothetical protein